MADQRIEQYARLLVEECLDARPGWQVVVRSTPLARPLVEEVLRALARRGAYALLRLGFTSGPEIAGSLVWALEAPDHLLRTFAPAERHAWETVDGAVVIAAPENTREATDLSPERQALLREAVAPVVARFTSHDLKWIGCQFPTPALAQDAGMSLRAFEDFLYGACLRDWHAERRRMEPIAARFDAASTVRIVGAGTDLTFSLEGRNGRIDALGANMPGGEVFYAPVENSAEGVVTFGEYPAVRLGREVHGARFVYRGGEIVEATANSGEDYLRSVLDSDAGARRLGEFGIGCNPGIQRYMRNTLFDEKMYGTIHLAVGRGYSDIGGRNESLIHWDMVKDLRNGGRIECDGEVVQQDGRWTFTREEAGAAV